MRKFIAILLMCHVFPLLWSGIDGNVYAQQAQLDSLKNILIKANGKAEKQLQLLNAIAPVQVNINPSDALANADKAIALAQKLNNQKELAVAFNNKGFVLLRKSQFDEATDCLRKSISIYTMLNDETGIANSKIYIAEILRRKGETDSAKIIMENVLGIYEKTNNLKGIADANYFLTFVQRDLGDFKKMIEMCNKAIEIYQSQNNLEQLALSYDSKCNYYYFIGEYDSALKYGLEANLLSEREENQYGLALSYGSLGHVYCELPDFPKTVYNHLKSLKIHEKMGNLERQANMNSNIGIDYYFIKNYPIALHYTSKSIEQMDELKISSGQFRMAHVYMGLIYFELGDTKQSLEHTNKAIQLCTAANDDWALSDAYNCLGNNFLILEDYYHAIINFKKALALKLKMHSPIATPEYFVGLTKAITLASDDELLQANINPSKKNEWILNYLKRALKIGIESNNKIAQRDALEQFSLFYEKQGDMTKSFEYYRQYIIFKDSINNTDNANAVALLQIQYDTEKREQQIALLTKESKLQQTDLQRQNTSRNALIVACALIALLAGIIFNRYRIKQTANTKIESTLHYLRITQEQLVEHEKLASMGKFTNDVAKEIEAPVKNINQLSITNRALILNIKKNGSLTDIESLKNNLLQIFNYGKEADAVVKKVLAKTRKVQG
jgi:tetratricopeptide (TPR) repeat protein